MANTTKPTLQAMILADVVHRDPMSGKFTILGTFNRIIVKEDLPKHFGHPAWLYLSITNIHGKLDLILRFVDLQDYSVVFEAHVDSPTVASPLEVAEFSIQMQGLPLPHEGMFALEVHVDNVLLGTHSVAILSTQDDD